MFGILKKCMMIQDEPQIYGIGINIRRWLVDFAFAQIIGSVAVANDATGRHLKAGDIDVIHIGDKLVM